MDARTAKQLFGEADRLFRQGQYEQALNALNQLNREFANQKNILYPAALCLEKLGRIEEAKVLCHQIIGFSDYPKARDLLLRLDTAPRVAGAAVENADVAAPPWSDEPHVSPMARPMQTAGANDMYKLLGAVAAMLIACILPFVAISFDISTGSQATAALLALPISGITLYVVMCYIFKRICENAGTEPGFLIWAPILSIIPIMRAADMHLALILLNFIPFVGGFVFAIMLGIKLCQACDKPSALGILFIFPGVNVILMFYLAFS